MLHSSGICSLEVFNQVGVIICRYQCRYRDDALEEQGPNTTKKQDIGYGPSKIVDKAVFNGPQGQSRRHSQ